MKKSIIALLALVTFAQVAMAQELTGSIQEFKLVQSSQDEDSNTFAKTVSKTVVKGTENSAQGFDFSLKATSRTSWSQGASIYDVTAAKLTVNFEVINTFGGTAEGTIVLFQNNGDGRGYKTTLAANCSISGNKAKLSCTSEQLKSGNFIKIELNR